MKPVLRHLAEGEFHGFAILNLRLGGRPAQSFQNQRRFYDGS